MITNNILFNYFGIKIVHKSVLDINHSNSVLSVVCALV